MVSNWCWFLLLNWCWVLFSNSWLVLGIVLESVLSVVFESMVGGGLESELLNELVMVLYLWWHGTILIEVKILNFLEAGLLESRTPFSEKVSSENSTTHLFLYGNCRN